MLAVFGAFSKPEACPQRALFRRIDDTAGGGTGDVGRRKTRTGTEQAEAAEKGVSVQDHATHLLVHGTLHLLGYDHQADADAAEMEAREIRALARLGISDPYAVND